MIPPFADPKDMTPEQRMDALAEVLAAGFLHLAESDQLKDLLAEESPKPTGEKNGNDK